MRQRKDLVHAWYIRHPRLFGQAARTKVNPMESGEKSAQSLNQDNDSNPSSVYLYNVAMATCIADPGLHDHLCLSLFHRHYSKPSLGYYQTRWDHSPILLKSRQQTGLSLRFIVVFASLLFTSYLATQPRSDSLSWQSTYRPVSIS